MTDNYHRTLGAQQDRARTFRQKDEEIKAQERIADALEAIALTIGAEGRRGIKDPGTDALIRVVANQREGQTT